MCEDGNGFINASGNEMDIVGVVDIPVMLSNKHTIVQEFKVLNSKSYSIILLGRDFMKKHKTVKFDFEKNKVQFGGSWINCMHVDVREKVRLSRRTTIPARSETVISVRCKKSLSLQTVDFDPVPVIGPPGIFFSKARVIPDVRGEFKLTVVNVGESDVDLRARTRLGFVHEVGKTVAVVDSVETSSPIDAVQFGANLSPAELSEAQELK